MKIFNYFINRNVYINTQYITNDRRLFQPSNFLGRYIQFYVKREIKWLKTPKTESIKFMRVKEYY